MTRPSALFAEDADFVDVFGNWSKDRMAIEQALAQRHATVFQNSRFTEKDVAVRFHKPDLAIVHAVIELSGAFAGHTALRTLNLNMPNRARLVRKSYRHALSRV